MLTEFEVRRRVDAIRSAPVAPIRKVRLLLRLGRSLDDQAHSLRHAKTQLSRTGDRNASASVGRLATTAELWREDVVDMARAALRSGARLTPG